MDIIGIYEIVILSAGIVGVYIRINNEVSKLKNRVYTLEQNKHEVTDMLKQLQVDIQEIKLLLARKQIDS
mgnify:CR=1 FL=1|jgi:hypothetical protein